MRHPFLVPSGNSTVVTRLFLHSELIKGLATPRLEIILKEGFSVYKAFLSVLLNGA